MTKKQFHKLSENIEFILTVAISGGIACILLLSGLQSSVLALFGGLAGTILGGYIGFRSNPQGNT
jgi:hypothetical protein